jgi:hypothetical protein
VILGVDRGRPSLPITSCIKLKSKKIYDLFICFLSI